MLSHIRRVYHSNCAGGDFKATFDEEMANAEGALKTLLAIQGSIAAGGSLGY